MRRVPIHSDVKSIKIKVALNMTKRQIICFSIGAAIGLPLFFWTKDALGISGAMMLMMVVMLPAFFFAMYEKRGQPCEVLLKNYIRAVFLRPKFRPNRAISFFTRLRVQYLYEKEVEQIAQMVRQGKKRKAQLSQRHKANKR